MWSSDYPHQESTFGYTRSAIQAVFDAGRVEDAQKILGKTALEALPDGGLRGPALAQKFVILRSPEEAIRGLQAASLHSALQLGSPGSACG